MTTITLPTPEAANAAYDQLSEADRIAVDNLGKELERNLHARQVREAKKLGEEIRSKVVLGPKMQHELAAKLYAFVAAKHKAATSSVPEAKAAPAIVEVRDGVTVIQFKSVVNFYQP